MNYCSISMWPSCMSVKTIGNRLLTSTYLYTYICSNRYKDISAVRTLEVKVLQYIYIVHCWSCITRQTEIMERMSFI